MLIRKQGVVVWFNAEKNQWNNNGEKIIKMNKQRTQGFTWFDQIWPTSTDGGLELLHYNRENQRE